MCFDWLVSMPRVFKKVCAFCSVLMYLLVLSGCAALDMPGVNLAKRVFGMWSTSSAEVTFNPAYDYLKTTFITRSALPAPSVYLAAERVHGALGDRVRVWYSADKDIIYRCQGRLLRTAGLSVDWRDVRWTLLPTWQSALRRPQHYQRVRTVMPGYHVDVQDAVTITHIPPPKQTYLTAWAPERLVWFEETVVSSEKDMQLPPSRYAVDMTMSRHGKVIYSEECLAKGLCFAFELWDVRRNQRKKT